SILRTGQTVAKRVSTTTTDSTAAANSAAPVGTASSMPSDTKKSVTKKSRSDWIFATTSSEYGKVERLTPAISAPIAEEKSAFIAAKQTRKHHEIALIRI